MGSCTRPGTRRERATFVRMLALLSFAAGAGLPVHGQSSPAFTPGNVLVTNGNILREYTPNGVIVQSFTVPHPDLGFGDDVTDMVVDVVGRVHVVNSAPFDPDYLSTYSPPAQSWEHHPITAFLGNISDGDLAILGSTLYTKNQSISTIDFSTMDLAIPGGNVGEVSAGLNGNLYVLEGGSPRNTVRILDPVTLEILDQFDLAEANDQRGIAVTPNGEMYIADWDGTVYHYNADGTQLLGSLSTGTSNLLDIDVGPDGTLVAGGRFGEVIVTDVFFSSFSSFDAGGDIVGSYVTVVPNAQPVPADVGVGVIESPLSGESLSSAESISVTLFNFGTQGQTGFPVTYTVTGPVSSTATETFTGALLPLEAAPFTFATSVDFSTPGTYTLEVRTELAGDSQATNDAQQVMVVSQTMITSFPYSQDFEADEGLFIATGENSAWERGMPQGSYIPAAASGMNAWVTDLDAPYSPGLYYLQSPPFDLTGMSADPFLQFSHIFELDFFDESWVEMSVNGGPFAKVGVADGPASTNWYNDSFSDWWDGTSGPAGQWRKARYVLLGAAGNVVSVRWVMQASPSSVGEEGVGVDDVEVFEAPFGVGQPPQPGLSTLDVNQARNALGFPVSAVVPGPYFALVTSAESLELRFEGSSNQPIVLAGGALQVGSAVVPPFWQLDLAPGFTILASGLEPGTGLNPFFFTNFEGFMEFSSTVPLALVGETITFQAAVLSPTVGAPFSNAVQVTIFP